jgi:hypothetical protein
MATNEEVTVRLTLLNEVSNEIKAMRANMEQEFGRVNDAAKQSQGAFSNLGSEIKGSFVSAIKTAVMAYAGFEVINKTVSFLKEAHKESQSHTTAIYQLSAALKGNIGALLEQATALEKTKFVHDTDILQAEQRLSNYFKEESQIRSLIPAIIDLSKAKGIDLATAANMVAVAWTKGEAAAGKDDLSMGRLGITFKKTGDEAQDLEKMISALNTKFGQQSKAVADSLDGWSKFSWGVGEAWKAVGRHIFGMSELEDHIQKAKGLEVGLAQEQQYLNDLMKTGTETYKGQWKVLQENIDSMKKSVAVNKQLNEEKREANRIAYASRSQTTLSEEDKKILENAKELAKTKKAAQKQEMADFFTAMEARDNDLNAALKMGEDLTKAKKTQDKQNMDNFFKDLELKEKAEKHVDQELIKAKAMSGSPMTIKKAQINERRELLKAQEKDELLIYGGTEKNKDKIRETFIKKQKALDIEMSESQKENAKTSLTNTVDMLGNLAAKHKEFTGLYKTMAVAKASWDTYEMANAAYKSAADIPIVGFIAAPIAAAAAIALGLSNVQSIASQGFQSGTNRAPGGMALLGEVGPEMAYLPRGSQVFTHNETRNMSSNSQIHLHLDGSTVDHSAVDRLEKMIPRMLEKLADSPGSPLRTFKSKLSRV